MQVEHRPTSIECMNDPMFKNDRLPSTHLGTALDKIAKYKARFQVKVLYISLYMCPHTTIYLSSYYYISVLILLYMTAKSPSTKHAFQVKVLCMYMCAHTAIYLSSYYNISWWPSAIYLPSYCYISVLILLYICPHTAIYLSSYCYMSSPRQGTLSSQGTIYKLIYVSSYYYISVLILLSIYDRKLAKYKRHAFKSMYVAKSQTTTHLPSYKVV
jgi:hypothetical protein